MGDSKSVRSIPIEDEHPAAANQRRTRLEHGQVCLSLDVLDVL